jgi:hypothetical protein
MHAVGAQAQFGKHAAGTAAGAIEMYEQEGSTIFATQTLAKALSMVATSGEAVHTDHGLKSVLGRLLGDR